MLFGSFKISNITFGTRLNYLVKQFVFGYHGSSATILSVFVLHGPKGGSDLSEFGKSRLKVVKDLLGDHIWEDHGPGRVGGGPAPRPPARPPPAPRRPP